MQSLEPNGLAPVGHPGRSCSNALLKAVESARNFGLSHRKSQNRLGQVPKWR
jgi:hypothetical protein